MPVLKEHLKEIVGLVELVPEQFKSQCFELLLKEAIENSRIHRGRPNKEDRKDALSGAEKDAENNTDQGQGSHGNGKDQNSSQAEISMNDLHAKTKRFLEKNNIKLIRLNELFYKENGDIKPLVEDYGSNKMADCQIRIALFQSLKNGLSTGEFVTTVEAVKAECIDRKTFDGPNWAAVFKRNASLFDYGEFSRDVSNLRLSEDGKQELARIIEFLG